ncbi:MAG: EAL domain-containing protein [Psychrobium sp.]|nr:EAL domain-containing protein [Psychrobium sp.]
MAPIKYFSMMVILFISTLNVNVNAAEFSRYLNNYSVEDGLSQSVVNQTIQDEFGYIWIATDFGLNRFDGYSFEQIPGPDNSFASDGIIYMSALSDGQLLISTSFNGTYLLDPETLQSRQIFSGKLPQLSKSVMSIEYSIELNDSLWFAIGQHLVSYHLKTNTMTVRYSLANDTTFIRALTAQDEYIYLATSNGLKLFNMENNKIKHVPHLPQGVPKNLDNNNVKTLLWHKTLGLLVGTVNGLYLFDPKTQQATQLLEPELNIWGLVKYNEEYFIATPKGLYLLNLKTKKTISIAKFSDINPLVTNDSIRSIFIDNSGLIWLASQFQGVFTFNPKVRDFSSYSRISPLQLSHSTVYDYFEPTPGLFWIATENGLNKIDSKLNTSKALFVSDDNNAMHGKHTIYSLFPQENGNIWLWHGDGLSLFDPRTEQIIPSTLTAKTNSQFSQSNPFGMQQVSPTTFVYIGAEGHFMLNVANNTLESLLVLNKEFKPEGSATFLPGFINGNHILLATTGGLIDYNYVEKTYRTIYQIEDFHINDYKYVSDWHRTQDGHIWLAINGYGVVELDAQYRVQGEIKKAQGLADLRVHGINASQSGEIWISSQAGLSKYNRVNKNLTHYSTRQGLISNEVFENASTLSNGKLAFNSAGGLIFFDPQKIDRDLRPPLHAKILSVAVASRARVYPFHQLVNKPFTLNYDDYGIRFKFSNFNFAMQQQVTYQIELKGKNYVFYDNYKKNSIEFTKLSPGNYEFSVRVKSARHNDMAELTKFKFSVKYNPYFSPMSYLVYTLIIASLLALLYLRRSRQNAIVQQAHEQVLSAKQRADLALAASNSGVWSFNQKNGFIKQSRLTELGYDLPDNCTLSLYYEYIHPADTKELSRLWHKFMTGEIRHWDVTYRVIDKQGDWIWYRDLGNVSPIKNNSQHQIFTGTYTNINVTKARDMQAQLYGQALRKMNEWLLILDHTFAPVTSNAAFNKCLLTDGEPLNNQSLDQVFSKRKLARYMKDMRALSIDQKLISEDIVRGADGFDIPVLVSISAIGESVINNYVIVISDLSEQKKVENKLKYLANFDPLTHLANRTLIRDRIEQAILHVKDNSIALLFIDLDRFKQVNDIHGHAVGDRLLVEVANRMNEVVGEQHSVGRQSGDEFIILLEDISQPEQASRYADLLTKRLSESYQIEQQKIHISASIGIAFYPLDSADSEELMQNADIAMLHAKERGRNGYRFFTDEMNTQIKQRVLIENEFIQAVEANTLTNYYQPIVDLTRRKMVGVELLLRWFNHDKMISPNVFIPLAESIGQIVKITELALEKALSELESWLVDDHYLSINLSALHITQPNIVECLLSILEKAEIASDHIRLEITEGVLIDDTENAKKQLNRLKDAGFRLFLDDFGTGYSSLTYINQFPIDVIKIDQCFVQKITSDKTSRAIVQTIANLAHNIDSYCVVEGVEELNQVAILKQLGCSHMQGYYFAKPMPALDLLTDESLQLISQRISLATKA